MSGTALAAGITLEVGSTIPVASAIPLNVSAAPLAEDSAQLFLNSPWHSTQVLEMRPIASSYIG